MRIFRTPIPKVMRINLYDHQKTALDKLRSGSILCGGVGSGKSRTALAYFFVKECDGYIPMDTPGELKMKYPKDLYIITTARKRDTNEWLKECLVFRLSDEPSISYKSIKVVIDSWNNIGKYKDVKDAFFIFDEQRVVGYGQWSKNFIHIAKNNHWILLSATPGDTWMDYCPVFIANGYFKNKTDFIRRHVVFSRYTKYPKIERYINVGYLEKLRDKVLVSMPYEHAAVRNDMDILASYNVGLYRKALKENWNVFEDQPIMQTGELCHILRKIVNTDSSRCESLIDIHKNNPKVIVFYNFNYELDLLHGMCEEHSLIFAEWNGHKHEPIPDSDRWLYFVQYTAGAEGWNCIETNVIFFYSQNYSYKIMHQAEGRIDRLNTPFDELKYYHVLSNSTIDKAIRQALDRKEQFNVKAFENIH